MLNPNIMSAFREVNEKLENAPIEWFFAGDANLALQGVEIKPENASVLIKEKDIDKIFEIFSDSVISEVKTLKDNSSEFFVSIKNTNVKFRAERTDGLYTTLNINPVFFKRQNNFYPCLNLKTEKEASFLLGMNERTKLIDKHLESLDELKNPKSIADKIWKKREF